jgi:hypothetical protein
MQNLDISKPIKFRNCTAEIQYMFSLLNKGIIYKHVFKIVYEDDLEGVVERYLDGSLILGCEHDLDVINVPEKPAFSWDKPFRFNAHSQNYKNKIIKHKINAYNGAEILIESHDESRIWESYNYEYASKFLENYEPEEKYEIGMSFENGKYDSWLDGKYDSWLVRNINNKGRSKIIAEFFESKKDAELFKNAKEGKL